MKSARPIKLAQSREPQAVFAFENLPADPEHRGHIFLVCHRFEDHITISSD
jgi:hypothetical protein